MADFPDLCYSESGYGWQVTPTVTRTEFSSKNTRQRMIIKNRDDLFSVTLKLTNDQLSVFETFVLITLNNGADTFTGPYWVSDVEKSGTLEIENGQYSVSYLTPNYWEVSYNVYVKDRDLTDEGEIYDLVNGMSGFSSMYDIIQATEDAVNNNSL